MCSTLYTEYDEYDAMPPLNTKLKQKIYGIVAKRQKFIYLYECGSSFYFLDTNSSLFKALILQ